MPDKLVKMIKIKRFVYKLDEFYDYKYRNNQFEA